MDKEEIMKIPDEPKNIFEPIDFMIYFQNARIN